MRHHIILFKLSKNWCENIPGRLQLISANKQPFITLYNIKQQTLISIRNDIVKNSSVPQVEIFDIQTQTHPRHLRHYP